MTNAVRGHRINAGIVLVEWLVRFSAENTAPFTSCYFFFFFFLFEDCGGGGRSRRGPDPDVEGEMESFALLPHEQRRHRFRGRDDSRSLKFVESRDRATGHDFKLVRGSDVGEVAHDFRVQILEKLAGR